MPDRLRCCLRQKPYGGQAGDLLYEAGVLTGIDPKPDGHEWEDLVLSMAAGELDRDAAIARLRELLPEAD